MGNEMLKVIMVMKDGTRKEFEGEGIVAYAITATDEVVSANGGAIGKFNDHCVEALITCLEEGFAESWARVDLMRKMKKLLGIQDGEEHMEKIEKD